MSDIEEAKGSTNSIAFLRDVAVWADNNGMIGTARGCREAADEIERLRADLKEARQAARECWRLIYESGENPISDTDCAALSEDRLWLEQR